MEGVGVTVNVALGVGDWTGVCVKIGVDDTVEVGVWVGIPGIRVVAVGGSGMVGS